MSGSPQEVLAIIPARGGSKGVPGKNIRSLGGKPLIAWTIEAALGSSAPKRVVVSTDDEAIAQIARKHGAEVPFLRPSEIAQDDTPDLPVCRHALTWLMQHEHYRPDLVAWLRPTAPLRTAADVDGAIELLQKTDADCVRSVCLTEHHPYWMKRLDEGRLVPFMEGLDENKYYRRQLLPPAYRYNGAVDVVRCLSIPTGNVLFGGVMLGYVMPSDRSIDLDTEIDFALADLLIQRRVT